MKSEIQVDTDELELAKELDINLNRIKPKYLLPINSSASEYRKSLCS